MVKNPIVMKLLDEGKIDKIGVIVHYTNGEFMLFRGRISKVIKFGGDVILKIKTGKDYPMGHKYIFRSLEEIV